MIYFLLAIGAPIFAHGMYDGFLMVQAVLPNVAGLLTLAVILLLFRLKKISKNHIASLLRKDGVG